MTEYKLADGSVLTDEDIERESVEFEQETWTGRLERIHVRPGVVADEPLVAVTVRFPASMVVAIDRKTGIDPILFGGPFSLRCSNVASPKSTLVSSRR